MAFPFAMQHFSALRRLVRNFLLSMPGFAVVRLARLSMSTHPRILRLPILEKNQDHKTMKQIAFSFKTPIVIALLAMMVGCANIQSKETRSLLPASE